MASKYNINSTWVVFATTNVITKCGRGPVIPCAQTDVTNIGIPQAAPDFTPPNPKDIITQALPQITDLQEEIIARQIDISSPNWGNNTDDVVDSISMPVFMISQAVQSMDSVKDIAK